MRAPRGSACAERVWCCYRPTRSEDPLYFTLGVFLDGAAGVVSSDADVRMRSSRTSGGAMTGPTLFRIAEKKPTIVPTAFEDADSLDVIAARAPLASVVPRGWRTCRHRFRNVVARARASGRIDSLRRAR